MATSPNATPTPITPPRVPLIDERTGLIDRAWYLFFLSLFKTAQSAEDYLLAPSAESLIANYDAALRALAQTTETQPPSGVSELAQEVCDLRQEVQTLPRSELGTFAALQQANLPWTTFDTTAQSVPIDIGTVAWDGGTTLGVQMTANVLLKVGEAEYVYAKASAAITKGQVCYHTGAVGSSGVTTVAPAPIGLTDPNLIVGIAAESIALNDFGLIQISGDLRGFNTTGSSVGETWADGDPLYYNPAYVGSMTKVKPSAPNQKTYMGEVINVGSGGSGSMHIRITPGSVLGGTDSNVEITSVLNNDLLVYNTSNLRWENKNVTTTFDLPTLSANGVLYLNSSKTAISGSALTFNGTIFQNTAGAIQGAGFTSLPTGGEGGQISLQNTTGTTNTYTFDVDSANQGRIFTTVSNTNLSIGQLVGTGGQVIFFAGGSEGFRLDASRNLLIGSTATPNYQVTLSGTGQDTADLTDAGNKGGSIYVRATGVGAGSGGAVLFGTTFGNRTPFAAIKGLVTDGATNTKGDLAFSTRAAVGDTALTQRMTLTGDGNLGLGTTSFGTSAAKVLSVGSGTEPSSGPADTVQFYSVDRSAGNTIPAFYCEGSGVTNAGITSTAVTHKIAMKVNGTIYYLLATTNAT